MELLICRERIVGTATNEWEGRVKPLGGLFFRGPTITGEHDLVPGRGVLGRPVWDRTAMLANLELRLGLPTPPSAKGVRLQQWSRRLGHVATGGLRFYSTCCGLADALTVSGRRTETS
jgi:hypothetical protein